LLDRLSQCHSLEIGLSQSNFLDCVDQFFLNETVKIFSSVHNCIISKKCFSRVVKMCHAEKGSNRMNLN
jgi:hypothetical protein